MMSANTSLAPAGAPAACASLGARDIRAMAERCAQPRRHALPSGLRIGTMPDTQLVGRTGPYEVEVLVRVFAEDEVEILGQVTLAERVHEPVCNTRVVLYDAVALRAVASVRTDHFGEFDLGRLPSARYFVAVGGTHEAPTMLVWEGAR